MKKKEINPPLWVNKKKFSPLPFSSLARRFPWCLRNKWIPVALAQPLILGWFLGLYNTKSDRNSKRINPEVRSQLGEEVRIDLNQESFLRGYCVFEKPLTLTYDPKIRMLAGKLPKIGKDTFSANCYQIGKNKKISITFITKCPKNINDLKDYYKRKKKFAYEKAYDNDPKTAWHSEVSPFPHFLVVKLNSHKTINQVIVNQGYIQDSGYYASSIDVYNVDDTANPVYLGGAQNLNDGPASIPLKTTKGRTFLFIGKAGPGPAAEEIWANRVWAVKEVRFN